MIEAQHFSFIRANQKLIRCDIFNGLQDVVNRGETNSSLIGRRIVLPTSFTSGTSICLTIVKMLLQFVRNLDILIFS